MIEMKFTGISVMVVVGFAAIAILWTIMLLIQMRNSVRERVMGEECSEEINSKHIRDHFRSKGYVVYDVKSLENNKKWLVSLVKDGQYTVITVFSENNNSIREYREVLV